MSVSFLLNAHLYFLEPRSAYSRVQADRKKKKVSHYWNVTCTYSCAKLGSVALDQRFSIHNITVVCLHSLYIKATNSCLMLNVAFQPSRSSYHFWRVCRRRENTALRGSCTTSFQSYRTKLIEDVIT